MMNMDLWLVCFIVKVIAKNLTKGQFAQNLKNRSDIYEHVETRKIMILLRIFYGSHFPESWM